MKELNSPETITLFRLSWLPSSKTVSISTRTERGWFSKRKRTRRPR